MTMSIRLSALGALMISSALIACGGGDSDSGNGPAAGAGGASAGKGGATAGAGAGGSTAGAGAGGAGAGGSTAGAGGSTAGAGGSKISCSDGGLGFGAPGDATCTSCEDSAQGPGGCCETEYDTCGSNPDCTDLLTCLGTCAGGDAACQQDCETAHTDGVDDLLAAMQCAYGKDQASGACGLVCQ